MNATNEPTPEELEFARNALDFPEDLDWTAEATVMQHQDDCRVIFRTEDWVDAMLHPYAGLEALFKDEAETYIHDTAGPGLHIAYRFQTAAGPSGPLLHATVHPAMAAPDGGRFALPDHVIARAEIRLEFQSPRTQALVIAAAEESPTKPMPAETTVNGTGPAKPTWAIDYTVLTRPEEASTLTGPRWARAIADAGPDPRPALDGEHTPVEEYEGQPAVFRCWPVESADGAPATVHATLHPVVECSADMEENLDVVLAEAEIRLSSKDPATWTALAEWSIDQT